MDATKLEGLGGLVDDIDGEAPQSPEQQAEAAAAVEAADSLEAAARQWGSIVYMIGGALSMVAPDLRRVYTEDACFAWGRAAAPVAEKYGWNGSSALPEIGLAIATLGLAVPSWFAIKGAIEKERGGWLVSVRDWWRAKRGKGRPEAGGEAGQDGG